MIFMVFKMTFGAGRVLERVVMECEPDRMDVGIESYCMVNTVRRGNGKWIESS